MLLSALGILPRGGCLEYSRNAWSVVKSWQKQVVLYKLSVVTNPVNCVIANRETTCHLSLWKQDFIVSFSEMCQEFTNKEGKKSSWSIEQLFFTLKIIFSPSPTLKSIFHLVIFEGICLKYVLLFSQISLIYLMHCAMMKVYHVSFSWSALFLLAVFTKTSLGMVYLLGGVIFCFVFIACILVHSSIQNDILLFILHSPNLTANNNHVRVLVFAYCFWKWNWKSKKKRLEFPLNLAVS